MAFDLDLFSQEIIGNQGFSKLFAYNCGADSFATVAAADYFAELLSPEVTGYSVATGDKLWVTSDTEGLTFSGTFIVATDLSTLEVSWDRVVTLSTQLADISAASTAYLPLALPGVITQVYAIQWSAVTVASAVLAFSIGSTAITGGAVTVPDTGVAGSLYTATPTAANVTGATSVIKCVSDGGSTDTAIATVGVKIVCPTDV